MQMLAAMPVVALTASVLEVSCCDKGTLEKLGVD